MKTDMRRELARQPFEQKIRQVGQLIKLSAAMKSSRIREEVERTPFKTATTSRENARSAHAPE
jgi:hypothetical protein